MKIFKPRDATHDATEIATDTARHVSNGGLGATILSGVAVLFSGYSLWESSLKTADVQVFVPRVISYAAPYQNTNFEMISIPVTLSNEGARTGTVLDLDLAVTDPRTKQTKHFYAAELGVWSMERTRTRAYASFAPLPLAGRTSRTEQVLFYTRGDGEKPEQIIREPGPYTFTLTVRQAEDRGVLGIAEAEDAVSVTFERTLPFYDARAFNEGTISMHAADWTTSSNVKAD
ncbi:hypothetical protein [Hyphomicrobium sp.]|uniref:hypothetical protein n=1 Tax=Hyphomicrobium sp. TaxID=82 RepID=UPI002BD087BD|nr:hypothetical protein [Hyphomicrobium sp.]HRN87974.1 hypothetical protein [Hyphomicrobium sp.]HRQ28403.1 hypothetical protein [Hyphomicrobium sp.]